MILRLSNSCICLSWFQIIRCLLKHLSHSQSLYLLIWSQNIWILTNIHSWDTIYCCVFCCIIYNIHQWHHLLCFFTFNFYLSRWTTRLWYYFYLSRWTSCADRRWSRCLRCSTSCWWCWSSSNSTSLNSVCLRWCLLSSRSRLFLNWWLSSRSRLFLLLDRWLSSRSRLFLLLNRWLSSRSRLFLI